MTTQNILRATFDDFAKAAGFTKKSGTWCRRQHETIAVLELQKSQYGSQYYVNVALWLLEIGEASCPKEHACHLRSRLTQLLPNHEDQLKVVLDLDDLTLAENVRQEMFKALLNDQLLPLIERCSTLDGIRALAATDHLGSFLITGSAQRLLEESAP